MNMEVPLYFYLAYKDLDRLSPGSDETTLKALDKVDLDTQTELNILAFREGFQLFDGHE